MKNWENYFSCERRKCILVSLQYIIPFLVPLLNKLLFSMIYIYLENHPSQGYGKQLVDYCINYLQFLGISTVRWSTTKDNTIAQQLYKKYGNGCERVIFSYKIN
ncbi:MAG: GNAT family N-acetyltransferase [Richelia sp.]|nr:GNAT family N-acetyltransferase [Richelia sp.]